MTPTVLECVVNVSEGRDGAAIGAIAAAGDEFLLDVHRDHDHNRSVLTLAGPAKGLDHAVHAVARATLELVDLRRHEGVHPRFGPSTWSRSSPSTRTGARSGPGKT